MGLHLPPSVILPTAWADKAIIKEVPNQPSGIEPYLGYWIESLQSWIASTNDEAAYLKSLAPTGKVTTIAQLPTEN